MGGGPPTGRHPVKRELSALLLAGGTGLALLALLYSTQLYYATQGEQLIRGFHDEAVALSRELQHSYFSARLPRGIDRSVRPRLSDPVAFTSQAELAYNEITAYSAQLLDLYARHPGPPFDAMRARLERATGEVRALHARHGGDPERFARDFSTVPLYIEIVAEQIERRHEAQGRALKIAQSHTALVSGLAFLAMAAVLGAIVFLRARRHLRAIDAILRDERAALDAARASEAALNQAARELRDALTEKEALLKEVYHRVKNNMQVVASLLAVQGRAAGPGEARRRLQESAERMKSIALVHEQLYRSRDLGRVAISEFVGTLLEHLGNIYSARARGISIKAEVAPMAIGIDYAVPLGLIAHELVSNACKHAFPAGGGTIRVALGPVEDGELELAVSDDGRGIPEGWSAEEANTLGSHLVATLSRQLGGTFRAAAGPQRGACFKVRFPQPPTPSEAHQL